MAKSLDKAAEVADYIAADMKRRRDLRRRADAEYIDELDKWANSVERSKFIADLAEYFDPTSLVLIVRAIEDHGIAKE